jgi:hypothetical protein
MCLDNDYFFIYTLPVLNLSQGIRGMDSILRDIGLQEKDNKGFLGSLVGILHFTLWKH